MTKYVQAGLYRTIWEDHHGKKIPEGYVIHHIDHDRHNNGIENLQLMTRSEHAAYHVADGRHPFLGRTMPDETRHKISETMSGEKNHFYGRRHSEESIEKMREQQRGDNHPLYGKSHSVETKEKMSRSRVGKIWVNDGIVNTLIYPEKLKTSEYSHFRTGRIKKENN